MKLNFSLTGKTALVTGGGGVICSVISHALASQGANVAVCDLSEERATAVAEEIRSEGGRAMGIKVDVLDRTSVEACAAAVQAAGGGIDILINGAGGNKPTATTSGDRSFFDLPEDALTWVFNLNLLGSVLPAQVVGRQMAKTGGGCIVNISSMAAYRPLTRTLAYSAAKAGISNFTQWLAVHMNQEYSPNIRVNAIAPGFLLTAQNQYLMQREDGSPTERGGKVLAHTPMNRYGTPEELCGAIVFLCSEEATFVNGVVLPVDGAFSAYSGV